MEFLSKFGWKRDVKAVDTPNFAMQIEMFNADFSEKCERRKNSDKTI